MESLSRDTVRVSLRFEKIAVAYATLCTCKRVQINKKPGHNVLCYTAQGQVARCCLNAAGEFSPSVSNFSLVSCNLIFPNVRGKSGFFFGSQEKFGCRCRTGLPGASLQGQVLSGQGRAEGGRAFSYVKTF